MTEIALRTYNQEIKDLIEHGHFDEAIAHCQHILETFPRHIETYRLLGKAFLEQGRHGDAADVFQRVLSAIPEDWLSHVAMAIVREDESNLDMAIWHMERAYEVNPSNPTVQQEVRRLRGRRDGVEPPKLRLTRSALARMYIKGGLYGQAIAEIRSALNEDPDRPDLQVLLASALFDSGAVQEAADICTTILQKLPYCLEANRVMGMALQASNKQEDADQLFQRIESLDPHIDLDILKKEKRIAELPGQTVSLSRLEYEGQEKTVRTKQPSWASSLGLKIEEPQKGPAIPDWVANASQPSAAFPPAAQPAAPAAPTGDIPAWLNEAASSVNSSGAGGSIFGTPVEPPPPSAPEPIARTATGELPDWIQAQAMPAEQPAAEKPSGPLPDWLSAATMPPQEVSAEPTTGSTLPDWIKTSSLPPEKPKEKISNIPDWLSAPPPPAVEGLPSSSLPEWTRPETKTSPLGVEPDNIPDWLSSSQPTSANLPPEPEWLKQAPTTAPGADAIPEWMKSAGQAEPPPAAAQPAESVPDWLKEDTSSASKPVELVPEWMRTDSPSSGQAGPAKPPLQAAPDESLPEWMRPDQNEAPISSPSSEPVLAGIKRTSPLEKEPSGVQAASTAVPEANIPEWMNPPADAPSAPTIQAAEAIPESTVPDWLNPPPAAAIETAARTPGAQPEVTSKDLISPPCEPAPLAGVESAQPADAPAPAEIAPASDMVSPEAAEPVSEIELPDWLKAVPGSAPPPVQTPSPASVATAEPPEESIPKNELPDWLNGGPPKTPFIAEKVSQPAPSTPSVQKMEPTQPSVQAKDMPAAEPGPTHVTPTASDGIDLPDWLVTQLHGKPADTSAATPPAAESPSSETAAPLPDWLKPSSTGSTPAPVVDWEQAASQPVPPSPVDATRPATGLSSNASAGGGTEVKGVLKPSGSDTVARWLDRRLKTSTLSSLDESALKAGVKPSTPPTAGRQGSSATQLPTWLDSQKPGGSDTVVRWMDKRETGSLRKVTASFSAVGKSAVPAPPEKSAPVPEASPKAAAPPAGLEAEVAVSPDQSPAQPVSEPEAPVFPKPITPTAPKPPEAAVSRPPAEPVLPSAAPVQAEDDEEGAFVPPPEWLQKALGSAVAEVPPIPKKQTGGLRPGTVSSVASSAQKKQPAPIPAAAPVKPSTPAPVESPPAVIRRESPPVNEPPPAASAKPGAWVPLAPAPAVPTPAAKPEKPAKKSSRKKTRKLTDIEAEALIREARVYLETDLQKATEAYQQVIDDPSSAEVVAGDLTTYLEQDPASPQLWNLLGDACSRAGRLQDAYRAYAEALRRM
jgi:tetratricopeptide (TPR) repeat protein